MINCPKCKKEFDPGKWKKQFCSRACANSRNFSKETNEKRSRSNKLAYQKLPSIKKDQVKIRLNSIRKPRKSKDKPLCIDCGKVIRKNKHERCQECYFKSDACILAQGHHKNYKRLTVLDSYGNLVYLMSSLEIKFYEYLTKNNIIWQKPKIISYRDNLNKVHFYRPDFHLIETDEIIEIKGHFWNNDKIKMKWVIEQNPILNIKILQKEDLKSLGV